jgi:hypothetical protein
VWHFITNHRHDRHLFSQANYMHCKEPVKADDAYDPLLEQDSFIEISAFLRCSDFLVASLQLQHLAANRTWVSM